MSRLLGKVVARRLSTFAENRKLFSDFQFGNRKHRSVIDAFFVVRMTMEMAAEVSFSSQIGEDNESQWDHSPVAVMFDIRKAFPFVDREGAFALFANLGMPPGFLQWRYISSDVSTRS